jgi:hypothetical protein
MLKQTGFMHSQGKRFFPFFVTGEFQRTTFRGPSHRAWPQPATLTSNRHLQIYRRRSIAALSKTNRKGASNDVRVPGLLRFKLRKCSQRH